MVHLSNGGIHLEVFNKKVEFNINIEHIVIIVHRDISRAMLSNIQ